MSMNRYPVLIFTLASACILSGIIIGFAIFGNTGAPASSTIRTGILNNISHDSELICPSFIMPFPDGSFLISDTNEKALYTVTKNGTIDYIISRDKATPYGYWNIAGTTLDNKGNIYVSDSGTHRILKFNKKGDMLTSFGGFGSSDGKFDSPHGIAIINASEGGENLLVCDTGNQRIQVFTLTGTYLRSMSIPKEPGMAVQVSGPKDSVIQNKSEKVHVIPHKEANPQFTQRIFDFRSSNEIISLHFTINRTVYLGAQDISFNSKDIQAKNPEEWIPILTDMLKDNTTQETVESTLAEIRKETNIKKISSSAKLESIIHFVQQIPLTEETENRYPVEILHDKKGNTYDKALFLYGLLNEADYDVVYLAYPGLSHAAVGIRLTDPLQSNTIETYQDSNDTIYMYINPDGPSFIGGIASKYRSTDPFVLHLTKQSPDAISVSADRLFSTFVVESIFSLSEKYQFLVNKEKEVKGDDAKRIRDNYQKIKGVLDFIEKNPWNTEISYMRIKNSKVNDIMV